MKIKPFPRLAFELWASGAGDIYCAGDTELPVGNITRIVWLVRGYITCVLFGWWWWTK